MTRALIIALALAMPAAAQTSGSPFFDQHMANMRQQAEQRRQALQQRNPYQQSQPYAMKPLAPLNPLGATQCRQVYACAQNGQCQWVQICQ